MLKNVWLQLNGVQVHDLTQSRRLRSISQTDEPTDAFRMQSDDDFSTRARAAFIAHDVYEGGGYVSMVALEKPLAVLRLNPTSEERQRALDAIDEDESTPLGIDDFCRFAAALRDEIAQSSDVSCTCGAVRMQFAAPAVCIGCVECCCSDCHRFLKWAEQQGGPTAPSVPHACYLRADFRVVAGEELLQACVLSAKTDVVRVVATCCHSTMFATSESNYHGNAIGIYRGACKLRPALEASLPLPLCRLATRDYDAATRGAPLPPYTGTGPAIPAGRASIFFSPYSLLLLLLKTPLATLFDQHRVTDRVYESADDILARRPRPTVLQLESGKRAGTRLASVWRRAAPAALGGLVLAACSALIGKERSE